MGAKKILMLVGDFVEDYEVMVPFQALQVDKAHVDGNLVTAPAWPAHQEWLAKFLEVLGTKIEH